MRQSSPSPRRRFQFQLGVVVLALLATVFAPRTSAGGQSTSAGIDGQPLDDISRDNLPEWLSSRASAEAIAFANLPVFDAARLAWEDEAHLVDQLDYQLEFRSYVDYMSREPDHIAQLLVDRPQNMGSESMGLLMTDAEVSEMQRRLALGDRMDDVVALVTGVHPTDTVEGVLPDYGPNFGGIWQDQLDEGKIVLAIVDASIIDLAAIEALLGGSEHLKVIEQAFTFQEIEAYREVLAAELDKLGVDWDLAAVKNENGRLLEVRVAQPQALPSDFGAAIPPAAFSVVKGDVRSEASRPSTTHSLGNQQPGLEIWVRGGSGCTWGFNGHTQSYHYIVTAGHCLFPVYQNYAGWVGSGVEIDQNGDPSRNLTPGNTYIKSVNVDDGIDAARIESSYADDNCYHGKHGLTSPPPHCGWPMAHRAEHNSWEVGSDMTCASLGNSNTYRCGLILEESWGVSGRKVRVAMNVRQGDSGAGMKWNYRIDGILVDLLPNSEALFHTAYDVQTALAGGSFSFNCYSPGSIVRSNPQNWGTCPKANA